MGAQSEVVDAETSFSPLFQLDDDGTEYRLISREGVHVEKLGDRPILIVEPGAIAKLAEEGFSDISHLFRADHLNQLRSILDDDGSVRK